MKRSGPIKRRPPKKPTKEPKPPKAKKQKPAKRKKKKVRGPETYGSYHRWISSLPCWVRQAVVYHSNGLTSVHKCEGVVAGHHVQHVSNGGVDYGNEIPLCTAAHTGRLGIHSLGKDTFQEMYNFDLNRVIADLAAEWDTKHSPELPVGDVDEFLYDGPVAP